MNTALAAGLAFDVVTILVLLWLARMIGRQQQPHALPPVETAPPAAVPAPVAPEPLPPPPPVGREPIDLRPDPTARFNVFRIDEHGQLALADLERYSGNDAVRRDQAVEAYQAMTWRGTVYSFEWGQLLGALT